MGKHGWILGSVLLALFSLVGCGHEPEGNALTLQSGPSAPSAVYGTWGGFPTVETDKGIKFDFELGVSPNQVTAYVTCTLPDGRALNTSVSGRAKVTAHSIESLEEKENVSQSGSFTCRAELKRGDMSYDVAGDVLTLRKDGQLISLSRVN